MSWPLQTPVSLPLRILRTAPSLVTISCISAVGLDTRIATTASYVLSVGYVGWRHNNFATAAVACRLDLLPEE
jgi:hypothetical protein